MVIFAADNRFSHRVVLFQNVIFFKIIWERFNNWGGATYSMSVIV